MALEDHMASEDAYLVPEDAHHFLVEKAINRLSLREFVVEFLGSFIPGLIFVIFSLVALALPILLFHETMPYLTSIHDQIHYDGSFIKDALEVVNSYKVLMVVFVLALGYVFGYIAMSQSLDYPDRRSWEYIFYRLPENERRRWAARDKDEALFPYANLKDFLKWRELENLAAIVPWTPNPDYQFQTIGPGSGRRRLAEKIKKKIDTMLPLDWRFLLPEKRTNLYSGCNKELFNIIKLQLRLCSPIGFSDLTRIEANIRLSATAFYMCRLMSRLCFVCCFFSILIALIPYGFSGKEHLSVKECLMSVPFLDICAFYFVSILISQKSIGLILRSLHKQRLREVVLVFGVASQHPEIMRGLGNTSKASEKSTS